MTVGSASKSPRSGRSTAAWVAALAAGAIIGAVLPALAGLVLLGSAAFSLKQSAGEGLTAAEAAAVQRWRKRISHIATQEMLHMSLVQNLLSAIGGAPHLSRPGCRVLE
jgi:Ferritin-like